MVAVLWHSAAKPIAISADILLLTTGIKEAEVIGTGFLYNKSPKAKSIDSTIIAKRDI